MKKLLASDVDGTLVFSGMMNIKDINAINNRDFIFAYATGRIKSTLKELPLDFDYAVLCNGGYIVDRNYKEIHKEVIKVDSLLKVYEVFNKFSKAHMFSSDGDVYFTMHSNLGDYISMAEFAVLSENDFLGSMSNLCMFNCVAENTQIVSEITKELLEQEINGIEIHINDCFIDVVAKNTCKLNGINKLLNVIDVERENVYVVGDNMNDLSMISSDFKGFAIEGSPVSKHLSVPTVKNVHEVAEELTKLTDKY